MTALREQSSMTPSERNGVASPTLRIPASKVHIVPQGKPGANIIERYVLDDALTLDDITYNGDGSVASLRVRKRDGSVITWQAN